MANNPHITDKSTLQKVGEAAGRPSSFMLNTIARATGADNYSNDDILSGKKFMNGGEFITNVGESFGLRYNTKGNNYASSFAKGLLELGVELAVDPLMYMNPVAWVNGTSKLTGRLTKLYDVFGKTASAETANVVANGVNKAINSAAVGGIIGVGVEVDEGDLTQRIKNTAMGAAAMPIAGHTLKAVAKTALPAVVDAIADGATKIGKEVQIHDFLNMASKEARDAVTHNIKGMGTSASKTHKLAKEIKESFKPFTRQFNKDTDEVLSRYTAKEADDAMKVMDTNFQQYVVEKGTLWKRGKFSKLTETEQYKIDRELNEALNKQYIAKMRRTGEMTPAVEDLMKLNANKFDIVNRHHLDQWLRKNSTKLGLDKHTVGEIPLDVAEAMYLNVEGKAFTRIQPIIVHTPEISTKARLDKYQGFNAKEGFIKRTAEGPIETGGLGAAERLTIENESFYRNMLDKMEHDIVTFSGNLQKKLIAKNKPMEMAESALDLFDKLNTDMKAIMLTGGKSWLVNNFKENVKRAFIEDGFYGAARSASYQLSTAGGVAIKQATGKSPNLGIIDELIEATLSPSKFTKHIEGIAKGGKAQAAVELGVVGPNVFTDITEHLATAEGRTMLAMKQGTEKVMKQVAASEQRGILGKMYKGMIDTGRRTVGTWGSAMENAARYANWETHLDASLSKANKEFIKKHGMTDAMRLDAEIADIAKASADRVNDIFFDYSSLTYGEEQILKRFMPFYSFASKNATYWGDALLRKPEIISAEFKYWGKLVGYDANTIKEFNPYLSEYEKSEAFTGAKRDEKGNIVTTTENKDSMFDALKVVTDPAGELWNKTNPLLKGAIQSAQYLGAQLGTEGPTDAKGRSMISTHVDPKKVGYGEKLISEVIHSALGNTAAVSLDPDKGMMKRNDVISTLGLGSVFIPPAIKRTMDVREKRMYREKEGTDTGSSFLSDFFQPVKKHTYSPKEVANNLRKSKANVTKQRQNRIKTLQSKAAIKNNPKTRSDQFMY